MPSVYEMNHQRIKDIAEKHGLLLNPDEARIQSVVSRMAQNFEVVGEWICPCKQQHQPPEKGKDKTCPCPEWLDEIAQQGHCYCRLFFASE